MEEREVEEGGGEVRRRRWRRGEESWRQEWKRGGGGGGGGEGKGERGKHVQFIPIPYEQCDTPGLGVTKLSVAPHKPGKRRRKRQWQ